MKIIFIIFFNLFVSSLTIAQDYDIYILFQESELSHHNILGQLEEGVFYEQFIITKKKCDNNEIYDFTIINGILEKGIIGKTTYPLSNNLIFSSNSKQRIPKKIKKTAISQNIISSSEIIRSNIDELRIIFQKASNIFILIEENIYSDDYFIYEIEK